MDDDARTPLQMRLELEQTEKQADQVERKLFDAEATANAVARTTTNALAGAISHGRQLDDVLRSLTLRLSDMALKSAFQPLTNGLASGLKSLFEGLSGSAGLFRDLGVTAATGAIKPFAAGGVIGTPTYFPLASGGLGLAGEAGPEAIVPLARGADGRLGIAGGGAGAAPVTINIAAQDVASFRGSEVYLTGQIARAVARGQRGL